MGESHARDALNSYLADHPYLNGYILSEMDFMFHETVMKSNIDYETHPHFGRWYNHIETFTDEEKAAFPRFLLKCERNEVTRPD